VLPFAIVFTLAVEIFAVLKFGRVKRRLRASLVVTVANLASFLLPLLFFWLIADIALPISPIDFISESPFYIVSSGFLLLTLVVELPIVFFTLGRETAYSSRLLLSIIISNTFTTAAIFVAEHLLCVRDFY
jgi:hypothetical protein